MKTSFFFCSAAAVVVAAAVLAISMAAQAPESQQAPAQPAHEEQPGGPPPPPRVWPAPTNLKVLPKNLTGQQVRDIMETWQRALGVHCDTCHMPDGKKVGPNGRPRLNFADDAKPQKSTARLMYKMTEDINTNYMAMVEEGGPAVTCGTCHRGHQKPEKFVPEGRGQESGVRGQHPAPGL